MFATWFRKRLLKRSMHNHLRGTLINGARKSLTRWCWENSVSHSSTVQLDKWNNFPYQIPPIQPAKWILALLVNTELKESLQIQGQKHLHAGAVNDCQVKLEWIHSEGNNPDNIDSQLKNLQGHSGGARFGNQGIEGKIAAIKYAREKHSVSGHFARHAMRGYPICAQCIGA